MSNGTLCTTNIDFRCFAFAILA
jgi:hypothetical protein